MKSTVRAQVKKILSKLLPNSMRIRYFSYLPMLEVFRKKHSNDYPVFKNRYQLYDYINNSVLKNTPIDFCEFGVYKGSSMKYWSNLNTNKNSTFYGFDSFEGLPETWNQFSQTKEKKMFSTEGQLPEINDDRITFIKGLYQDTLPEFFKNFKNNHQLLIHNDSDLYSSTLYVLTFLNHIIVPETIIMFDDFTSMLHEFRAFDDYCSSYYRDFEMIGATVSSNNYYYQLAVRMK